MQIVWTRRLVPRRGKCTIRLNAGQGELWVTREIGAADAENPQPPGLSSARNLKAARAKYFC
jgi:hypothetical protein